MAFISASQKNKYFEINIFLRNLLKKRKLWKNAHVAKQRTSLVYVTVSAVIIVLNKELDILVHMLGGDEVVLEDVIC